MRRSVRPILNDQRNAAYLLRQETKVNDGADVQKTWTTARKSQALATVARLLGQMTGNRQRCMFCDDSRGTDIEHFWPKSIYPRRAFRWVNLLWACAGCNRKKGDRFDVDASGRPLLIDPTAEDPWDHLFFDPDTGNLTARYDIELQGPDPKGQHTTDASVLPLNVEAVTEGRLRTYRNLRRAVVRFLESVSAVDPDVDAARRELVEAVRDNDGYGLVQWFLLRAGSDRMPFATLRSRQADWEFLVHEVSRTD